jgi:hypothetical protein
MKGKRIMIINNTRTPLQRTIDLRGPEGNAFALLGYAKSLAKQLEKNSKKILEEMMSGDYENLVNVFEREFGDYVTLSR